MLCVPSPVVKATGPHPCALAVPEPDGATGLQIRGRRQCQPQSSEKEEQTSQDFSPGHKEKLCCLAWSFEECSAATELLLVLPLPYPFPVVMEAAIGVLQQRSIVQTLCCAAVLTSHSPTASKRQKKYPSKQTQSHGSSLSVEKWRCGARRKRARG